MVRLYKRDKYWYIDFQYKGRRYQRSLGVTSRVAAEAARGRVEFTLAQGKSPFEARSISLYELIRIYLEYCVGRNRPHTLKTKRLYCERFLKHFGNAPINDITRADVERYVLKRAETAGAFTVNRELATLRHALNFAIERDLIERNPAAKIKLLPEEKRFIKILSDDELSHYFSWCAENDPLLYDLSVVAFSTGLRRGDVLKIRGEDIDDRRGVLNVKVSKRRGELILYLPLNDAVREVLARRKKRYGKNYIFPGKNGGHQIEFKRRFARAVRETGIEFRFADLRHNCATALLGLGADLRTVQSTLGPSSITTTERYLTLIDERQRQALNRLGEKIVAHTLRNPSEFLPPKKRKKVTP